MQSKYLEQHWEVIMRTFCCSLPVLTSLTLRIFRVGSATGCTRVLFQFRKHTVQNGLIRCSAIFISVRITTWLFSYRLKQQNKLWLGIKSVYFCGSESVFQRLPSDSLLWFRQVHSLWSQFPIINILPIFRPKTSINVKKKKKIGIWTSPVQLRIGSCEPSLRSVWLDH